MHARPDPPPQNQDSQVHYIYSKKRLQMKTINRLLTYLIIVSCVTGVLISLACVIGVWVLNNTAQGVVGATLEATETGLQSADNALERVQNILESAGAGAQRVESAASELGDKITQGAPAVTVIETVLGEELGPKINTARETMIAVRDSVTAFNSTLAAANRLPGIQIPTLNNELQATSDRLADLSNQVSEMRTQIAQAKAGDEAAITEPVSERTQRIANALDVTQANLQAFRSRLATVLQAVQSTQNSITFWLDLLSFVFSIFLVWVGATQVYIILQARKYLQTSILPWQAAPAANLPASIDEILEPLPVDAPAFEPLSEPAAPTPPLAQEPHEVEIKPVLDVQSEPEHQQEKDL